MTGGGWVTRRPLLIAHRGGAHEAPENTLHAFRHGVACGAQMVELDLHATADGEVVVIHDRVLDRTTDGTGPVARHRLADVLERDAAHWFVPGRGAAAASGPYPLRGVATGAVHPPEGVAPHELRVPTLDSVLRALPRVWLTMELKVYGLHERVAELLVTHGRESDVIIGGFAPDRLEAFRALLPQVPTSATESEVAAFWRWAHGVGQPPSRFAYDVLQVPTTYEGVEVVTASFVLRAHDCGVGVHVWTVDDPAAMHRLLDLGVDGIMTDRPSVLARVLAERAAARRVADDPER